VRVVAAGRWHTPYFSGQVTAFLNQHFQNLYWAVGSSCLATRVTWSNSFGLSLGTYDFPCICIEVKHQGWAAEWHNGCSHSHKKWQTSYEIYYFTFM